MFGASMAGMSLRHLELHSVDILTDFPEKNIPSVPFHCCRSQVLSYISTFYVVIMTSLKKHLFLLTDSHDVVNCP